MTTVAALALVGGFVAVAWLIHEVRIAPVIEDATDLDPWLAEDVRAALNSVEGYPIGSPVPPRPAPQRPGQYPPAGAHPFPPSFHSTGNATHRRGRSSGNS